MQIDWVTVAAQIVNFLVLVWLLQRVLYRPLTRALKAREEEVNRSLREAEAARETAEVEAEAHRDALRALEDTRHARLAAVAEEAEALRAEMTETARGELAERRTAWQAQLEHEKAAFLDRLRRRAGEAFVTLARRALADMADEDLVDRIARVFAQPPLRAPPRGAEASEIRRRARREAGGPGFVSALAGDACADCRSGRAGGGTRRGDRLPQGAGSGMRCRARDRLTPHRLDAWRTS